MVEETLTFREIENTTIYELSADLHIIADDLLLLVRPNTIKKNTIDKDFPYYSYNSTIKQLSAQIEDTMLRKHEEVSGQWSFNSGIYVDNYKLSGKVNRTVAVTKWYADQMSADVMKHLRELSTMLFDPHHPILPHYSGLVVFSTIRNASDLAKYFFKSTAAQWRLIGEDYYLAGANKDDSEYTIGQHTKNANGETLKYDYTLTNNQIAIKSHVHTFSGSTSANLKHYNSGATNVHGKGFHHAGSGVHTGHGYEGGAATVVNMTSSGSASSNGSASFGNSANRGANASFDNRPNYIKLYIWRRI